MDNNAPMRLLQMTEVYQGEDEKGIVSFVLLLQDADGNRYGTTLICRAVYADGVKKSFNRVQGVPLPPKDEDPATFAEPVTPASGDDLDAQREAANTEEREGAAIEPDGI